MGSQLEFSFKVMDILHTLVNICKSHVYVNRYQGLWARHWIGIPGITPQPTLSINDKKTIKSRKIGLQTKTEIRFVKQGLQKSNKTWVPRARSVEPLLVEDFRKKQSQRWSVINCNNITKAGVKNLGAEK